jgi:steroid 5-alpha reductase family enzyme
VSGLPAGSFGLILLATAVAVLTMMAVTFAVALKAGKHSVVDTAWGIGIALTALTALVAFLASAGRGQPARRYLLLAASVLWGTRLAVYVGWRNHGKPEDPRYRDLLSRARRNRDLYALRVVYLLQALILWLATIPVQAGMLERAPAGPLAVIGAIVWLAGFIPLPPKRSGAGAAPGETAAGRSARPATGTRRRWRSGPAAPPGR